MIQMAARVPIFRGAEEVAMGTTKPKLAKLEGKGLVPACSWCKKIRDPSGKWIDPVFFCFKFFGGKLTHTICEECSNLYFPNFSRNFVSHQQVDTL
jgi:hypothetical protein